MNDLDRPIVVAVAPVGEASWSGVGPVGVLRFRDRGASKLAIAVRVVGPFPEEGGPLVPGFPMPASSPVPPLAGLPPLSGRELVPWKPLCDVALVGTVARPGVHLGPHAMPLEIAIGEVRRRFTIPLVDGRAPLAAARAIVLGGEDVSLAAPEREPLDDDRAHDLDEDGDRFQSAPAALRVPWPRAGTSVEIRSDALTLSSQLGFDVFVRVDYLDDTISLPVVRCDAMTFDLDRREVECVFRGVVIDPAAGREIERIVVGVLAPGQDEERARIDAWLPHATFLHAARPADLLARRHPPPLEDDELAIARYATWDLGPAASTMPVELVARIQVELLRGRPRAEVLASHEIEPYQWDLEERAAMERIAGSGAAGIDDEEEPAGAGEELARYRTAYAEAMATTPTAHPERTAKELAELTAALEVDDPIAVLQRAGITPGELVDLQMTMDERFERDPAERRTFDQRYEEALVELRAARSDPTQADGELRDGEERP